LGGEGRERVRGSTLKKKSDLGKRNVLNTGRRRPE